METGDYVSQWVNGTKYEEFYTTNFRLHNANMRTGSSLCHYIAYLHSCRQMPLTWALMVIFTRNRVGILLSNGEGHDFARFLNEFLLEMNYVYLYTN